jgi:hypothetical protein
MKRSIKVLAIAFVLAFTAFSNVGQAQTLLTEQELRAVLRMKADLDECESNARVSEDDIKSLVVIKDRQSEIIKNHKTEIGNHLVIQRDQSNTITSQGITIQAQSSELKIVKKGLRLSLTIGIPIAFVGGVYVGYQVFK